jgi:hypothetical protein
MLEQIINPRDDVSVIIWREEEVTSVLAVD